MPSRRSCAAAPSAAPGRSESGRSPSMVVAIQRDRGRSPEGKLTLTRRLDGTASASGLRRRLQVGGEDLFAGGTHVRLHPPAELRPSPPAAQILGLGIEHVEAPLAAEVV